MTGRQRTFLGLAGRSFGFWFGGIWLLCGVPFLVVGLYAGVDTIRQQARFRVFEEQIERRKLDLLVRARERARQKQQPR